MGRDGETDRGLVEVLPQFVCHGIELSYYGVHCWSISGVHLKTSTCGERGGQGKKGI